MSDVTDLARALPKKRKQKKDKMEAFWILFITCFLLVLLVFVVAIVLRVRRSSTKSTDVTVQDLQSLYDKGTFSTNLELTDIVKPFAVTSSLRNQFTTDIFRTSLQDAAIPIAQTFAQSQLSGFTFVPQTPLRVTDVQVFVQFLATPLSASRSVALVDMSSGPPFVNLLSVDDRKINLLNQALFVQNGLLTQHLQTPVALQSFKVYGFMGIVESNDRSIPNDQITQSYDIDVKEGINGPSGVLNIDTISAITLVPNATHLFAFRVQPTDIIRQTIWDVDNSKGGYGRFPPGYVRGLNISVINNGDNVLIEKGFALSALFDTNMVLFSSLQMNAQVGLNGLDTGDFQTNYWYHVYVIGSSRLGLPTASLLSLGSLMPQQLPNGYDVYRRLGAVRWTGSAFDPIRQDGDGPTRTTFYLTTNINAHRIAQIFGSTNNIYIPTDLTFVPPTAFRCALNVSGFMSFNTSNPQNSSPKSALVRFRRPLTTTEGNWTVSLQDAQESTAQLSIELTSVRLPLQTELKVFTGPGGSIPNSPSDPNVGQYRINVNVTSYTETI